MYTEVEAKPQVRVYSMAEKYDPVTHRTVCRHYHRYSLNYMSSQGYGRGNTLEYIKGSSTEGPHTDENIVCATLASDMDRYSDDFIATHAGYWRNLDEVDLLNVKLNQKNAPARVRHKQAEAAKRHGFVGPIKGGEARALANMLKEMGKSDSVRRLYVFKQIERVKYPGTVWERKWTTERLCGPVYAFKPFLEGFSFLDFMRVVRMLRPGTKNARQAIREAMANPDMKDDLTMLQSLDILCGMKGGT